MIFSISHSYFSAPTFSPDLFYIEYVSIDASEIIWTKVYFDCGAARKKNVQKRREKRGPLLFSLSSKKRSATPISLLLIKRSGTPPSLPILGVALGSGAQKSAAL